MKEMIYKEITRHSYLALDTNLRSLTYILAANLITLLTGLHPFLSFHCGHTSHRQSNTAPRTLTSLLRTGARNVRSRVCRDVPLIFE